jgi:hypothetical protein
VIPHKDPWTAALERLRSSGPDHVNKALAAVLVNIEEDWHGRVLVRVTNEGVVFTPKSGIPWRAHVQVLVATDGCRYEFYRRHDLLLTVSGPDAAREDILPSLLVQLEAEP